jgi:peptide/nickel transport system permease protein
VNEGGRVKRAGALLLAMVGVAAIAAPWLAPNPPNRRFTDLLLAPPTRVYLFDEGLTAPYIYPWRLLSRIEYRFEEARPRQVPLRWFTAGGLVSGDADLGAPLLVLGADGYGRDILSRLLYGSRTTLALALLATAAATLVGLLIGGVAGYAGGWLDGVLSRTSEFVLVLPAIYVALALRAVMPLVLPPEAVFLLLTGIFTVFGWPIVARGVRAIVITERGREYAAAARAAGAGDTRILVHHLLPAARGYITTQATLLLPAFIVAEATLSYVGLGFPDTTPTWGTMLQEASNVALLDTAPWTLAPAAAIFVVVLGVNLLVQSTGRAPVQFE